VASGRLGTCEVCGGAIPPERLRALPDATRCIRCAREAEAGGEPAGSAYEPILGGEPIVLVPGGEVETPEGEGRLVRLAPFGTCGSCGEVEGRYDAESDDILCATPGCELPLADLTELAVVEIGDETLSFEPELLRPLVPEDAT
jgi:hypothetical protein